MPSSAAQFETKSKHQQVGEKSRIQWKLLNLGWLFVGFSTSQPLYGVVCDFLQFLFPFFCWFGRFFRFWPFVAFIFLWAIKVCYWRWFYPFLSPSPKLPTSFYRLVKLSVTFLLIRKEMSLLPHLYLVSRSQWYDWHIRHVGWEISKRLSKLDKLGVSCHKGVLGKT